MSPEPRSDPRLCIRWSPAIRVLQSTGAVLLALVGAGGAAVVFTLVVGALRSGHPSEAVVWAVVGTGWILFVAAIVVVAIRTSRMTLVADERGLTVRNLGRSTVIPWGDYQGAKRVDGWRWRGAVRVRSARRPPVVARITAEKYSLLRSDVITPRPHPLPRESDRSASMLVAAIADAHQFWQRSHRAPG